MTNNSTCVCTYPGIVSEKNTRIPWMSQTWRHAAECRHPSWSRERQRVTIGVVAYSVAVIPQGYGGRDLGRLRLDI